VETQDKSIEQISQRIEEIAVEMNQHIEEMHQRLEEMNQRNASLDPKAERSTGAPKRNAPSDTDSGPPPQATGRLDYLTAAVQVGAAAWASPELRKGPAQFLVLLPAVVSLADRVDDGESRGIRALVPAGIGALALILPRILKM
jgi:hypothetical protein